MSFVDSHISENQQQGIHMPYSYNAMVVVGLNFASGRPTAWSNPTMMSFVADSRSSPDAWLEFLDSSCIDPEMFGDGVDPFDPDIREERWEYLWIERIGGQRMGPSPGAPPDGAAEDG
jgi:hypothetical protein